jgi:prepilin-type N-terminal cleavage/methylation domain-containing protein
MRQRRLHYKEQVAAGQGKMAGMECSKTGKRVTRDPAGFTLAETMVGMAIFVIVMTGLITVFTMSMLSWKEGSRDLSLQGGGRLIIEKIVRGPGGRFGLREAAEGHITIDEDGRGITFLVDKNNPPTFTKADDTEQRIYLANNKVMYDPSTEEVGDEVPLVRLGRVEDISFELDGKAINVNLWMRETSETTHPSDVKLSTKVFLRKSEDPDTET